MKISFSLILLSAIALISCGEPSEELGPEPLPENYEENVSQWIDDRIETLKEPTGWLRLAGMYVLEEGENSFGSGNDRDVQFPEGTIAEQAGTFILEGNQVRMRAADGVEITAQNEPVTEMVIFDGEDAPEIQHGSLEWFVIQRQDLIAIRLYNKENEKADRFDGFDRYPIKPDWHLKARFIPNPDGSTMEVPNVLGQTEVVQNPGAFEFRAEGETYRLQAIERDADQLFVIVGDLTNQEDTYQAGRFIYVDHPDENGYSVIDFNKLYNPPCAYNRYTTCQLPPASNRLDLAITAGEKRPVDWDGL